MRYVYGAGTLFATLQFEHLRLDPTDADAISDGYPAGKSSCPETCSHTDSNKKQAAVHCKMLLVGDTSFTAFFLDHINALVPAALGRLSYTDDRDALWPDMRHPPPVIPLRNRNRK